MSEPTGPFYFAWVNPDDDTFGPSHLVWDEEIFDFSLSQREGDFALLTLTIRNPFEGLLSAGRKQWAWFSYQSEDSVVRPLFFGQLLRVPDDMRSSVIAITLRAKPIDYEATKLALASTMKNLPYFDPVMIARESHNDPDAVLQARTELWHVDRVTHQLTTSDNIVGEDGLITFDPEEVFYNSVRMRVGAQPASRAIMEAAISFNQRAVGEIDLSQRLIEDFEDVNGQLVDATGVIGSFTADGLIRDWPVPGDEIGSGWRFTDTNVEQGNGRFLTGETILANSLVAWLSNYEGALEIGIQEAAQPTYQAGYIMGIFKPTIVVGYERNVTFTENISFTLYADVQSVAADDADPIRISLSSNDASEPIDTGGAVPIGDLRRNSYIKTDRGQQTLQYLILRARAELIDSARAISIDFTTRFNEIFNITCRKNGTLLDPRLPGGEALGKIVGYEARGSGDTGEFLTTVTIGCCVGNGQSVAAADGAGDYIENDYIESDHFVQTGKINLLDPGDVTYADYSATEINDDGVNLFDMSADQCCVGFTFENVAIEQREAVREAGQQLGNVAFPVLQPWGEPIGFFQSDDDAAEPLIDHYTTITLEMILLDNGPFETDFNIVVSELMVPQQIDLGAT